VILPNRGRFPEEARQEYRKTACLLRGNRLRSRMPAVSRLGAIAAGLEATQSLQAHQACHAEVYVPASVGAAVGAESRDDPGTAVGLAAAEVEIDDLLGQVAELEAAAGELDPVGVGAPVAAGIAEEDEGDQGDYQSMRAAIRGRQRPLPC